MWNIEAVVFEQPHLRRYHVRHVDGRPAMMDVAVAGTPAAASLVAFGQTLPPGYLLDQGADAQGNPFVVAIHAAFAPPPPPPLPPPPPRQPMTKATRNLLIGLGVASVVGIGGLIVWQNREKPKPKLRMSVSGSWSSGCYPKYTVHVETRRDAKVKVLGKEDRVDYDGAQIVLTQAELGDRKEIEVEADHKKGYGKETLLIEPPPTDFPPLKLVDSYSYNAPTVTMSIDGGPFTTPETDYGYNDDYAAAAPMPADPGAAVAIAPMRPPDDPIPPPREDVRIVQLRTCKVQPLTVQVDGTKLEATGNTMTITVDLGEQLIRTKGTEVPTTLEIPLNVTTESGQKIALKVTVDTSNVYGTIAAYERLKSVATTPNAEALLPGDVASPKPILMVWNTLLDRQLLGDTAPVLAPFIAVIETSEHDSGSCGPYSEYSYYGGGGQYATRYRTDASVKLYEARTGNLVDSTYIKGKKPSCPSYVTTYGGVVGSISGDTPNAAVMKWLKQKQ